MHIIIYIKLSIIKIYPRNDKNAPFLLTLIYFTNCIDCSDYDNPQSIKECISLHIEEGNKCCFIDAKCQVIISQLKFCTEENKDYDVKTIKEALEYDDIGQCENPKVNVICNENELNNSCYLKIGILLILGLLF